MSEPSKHILIIGGGVIGLCTARQCVERGHRVTIIDQREEDRGGATAGNAGMIVPSHFVPLAAPGMVALALKWMLNPESPFYIKPRFDAQLVAWGLKFWRAATPEHVIRCAPVLRDLHLASRKLFVEMAAEHDFGLAQRGLLMLCKTQHALDEEAKMAEQARQLNVPAEVLDARETASIEPNIRMDIAGAVYFPKDCHLSPDRFLSFLRADLKSAGVEFRWNTSASGFHTTHPRVNSLSSSAGDINADEFVLCGGSWAAELARELGINIPLQAGKGYSLTLPKPRQVPDICAILAEARVAVTPMNGSLRFGGTMEISGLNEEISDRRVQGIIKAASRYYPEFTADDFAGIQPWRGLRPCSPDGLPYIGRSDRFENVTVATGHGMMGLSLGPITGKLAAEVISGEPPSVDISLLSPDRYT